MNKQSNNSDVDLALTQWGRYCRQVGPVNIGYPRKSPYAAPSPSAGCAACDLDEEGEQQARRVDRMLAQLKQLDDDAYRALEQLYLWRVSAVEAAARVGVSRTVFYAARGRGESFVAGALYTSTEVAA